MFKAGAWALVLVKVNFSLEDKLSLLKSTLLAASLSFASTQAIFGATFQISVNEVLLTDTSNGEIFLSTAVFTVDSDPSYDATDNNPFFFSIPTEFQVASQNIAGDQDTLSGFATAGTIPSLNQVTSTGFGADFFEVDPVDGFEILTSFVLQFDPADLASFTNGQTGDTFSVAVQVDEVVNNFSTGEVSSASSSASVAPFSLSRSAVPVGAMADVLVIEEFQQVAPIPLPATGLLLLGAFATIGSFRFRRVGLAPR